MTDGEDTTVVPFPTSLSAPTALSPETIAVVLGRLTGLSPGLFPLRFVEVEGKAKPEPRPLVRWREEPEALSLDMDAARDWGRKHPGLAAVCSHRLLVVDCDGPDARASFLARYTVPDTFLVRTPREGGGWHYYFEKPPGGELGGDTNVLGIEGLDIRTGPGSMIVVPPSRRQDGRYTIECDAPVAEAPEQLVEDLLEWKSGKKRSASTAKSGHGATVGTRHNTLRSDVGRWRNEGCSLEEIIRRALTKNSLLEEPETEEEVLFQVEDMARRFEPGEPPSVIELIGTDLSTVEPVPVEWLWRGYIPLRHLTLFDGDPGLGKSTVTLDLAARVSKGLPMPDGSEGVSGGVLIFTTEDNADDTIVPRLRVARANLRRIRHFSFARQDGMPVPIQLPSMAGLLAAKIRKHRAALVILDTVLEFTDEKINENSAKEVRKAMAALREVAQTTGCAVIGVRHLNKGTGKALYRGSNSGAFIGTARAGCLFYPDPEDEDRAIFDPYKGNLSARRDQRKLAYVLVDHGGVARVEWSEGPVEVDREEALQPDRRKGHAREQAGEWLAVAFAGHHTELAGISGDDLERRAAVEGIKRATLDRARRDVGLHFRKRTTGETVWWLPLGKEL